MTVEKYILIAKRIGLSIAEFKYFDIGDILDVANEYISEFDDENTTQATQEDFDNF